jgi:hypothetical protein
MPVPSSLSDGPESRTSATSDVYAMDWTQNGARPIANLSPAIRVGTGVGAPSGPAVFLVKTSASPASDEDSPEPAQDSLGRSSPLWSATDLPPSSSRTYRASSPVMAARILGRSSVAWANSGMGGPTGFSTLATSECRSADGACSSSPSVLAQVLEPTAPPRFFLSARAAAGILRRASKRGRTLPTELDRALTSLAQSSPPPASDTTRTSTPSFRWQGGSNQDQVLTDDQESPTLAFSGSHHLGHHEPKTMVGASVRRLTPVECERLMGWPDGHTIVAGWPRKR